jgi:hypothetical protein
MTIKSVRDETENLIIYTVIGLAEEDEMHRALESQSECGPTFHIMWDMSLADVAHVTPEILRRFVKRAAQLGDRRKGGRTAVIAPKDLQFGMARMSEVYNEMESAPFSFRAFRSRDEALQWLKSDIPEQ